MKYNKNIICILLILLAAFLATSCLPVPLYIDDVADDKAEKVVIGKTTKEEMHNLFGNPYMIQEDLNIEVYWEKCTVYSAYVGLVFWAGSDPYDCFALAKYKDDILINIYAKGVSGVLVGSDLKLDEVVFDSYSRSLMIPWDSRDSLSDKCKVYIAPTFVDGIFIDQEYIGYGSCEKGFYYRELTPGEHLIKVRKDANFHNDSDRWASLEFTCHENESIYFKIFMTKQNNRNDLPSVVFQQSNDVPDWFGSRRYLILQSRGAAKN